MAQYMSPAATNLALEGRGEAREVAVVAIAQRRASLDNIGERVLRAWSDGGTCGGWQFY